MGKPADVRLRCVHCHNTETPLWRAGPDGPKTLCNACGVRYKKGKLILYKKPDGALTAIKYPNSTPVHVPPAPKKKKSPASPPSERIVKKVPSDSNMAKKPRSRSRRMTAGQLPGRYAAKTLPDHSSRSPASSSSPAPSSPAPMTIFNDPPPPSSPLLCFPPPSSSSYPSLYPFVDPDDDTIFPDMACLGLDCSAEPDNSSLLPMPADPSSAEQFTFAFSSLHSPHNDKSAPVEALRSLLRDRTRPISTMYDDTVQSLVTLCEQRYFRAKTDNHGPVSPETVRHFVRAFAQEHASTFIDLKELGDLQSGLMAGLSFSEGAAPMLSEQTSLSSAAEKVKTLMDSAELAAFAETCMVELLAEDVVGALGKRGHEHFDTTSCRVAEQQLDNASSAIPTMV